MRWNFASLLLPLLVMPGFIAAQQNHSAHRLGGDSVTWTMPPMGATKMPMLPGLEDAFPSVSPFLPVGESTVPEAVPGIVQHMESGDTLHLIAQKVRRSIHGRTHIMYGFNGQYPGPLIRVGQSAEIIIRFDNQIDLPTMIHWHGVRLDNRFDGTHAVQEPVEPGGTFIYKVRFPDAGIYWYHPHMREDIQQDLGLYGNILVNSHTPDYYNIVNREVALILDDLLITEEGTIFPYGREAATHTLMGRFGNLFLLNGEADWRLTVQRGEVVRFFLTNVSNTRTFNLSFGQHARLKLIGADISRFEREQWVESVVIAPAQRYTIEVKFDESGEVAIVNRVQGIDHFLGSFSPQNDTLGRIVVTTRATSESHAAAFEQLRDHEDVISDIFPFRDYFAGPVDRELILSVAVDGLPASIMQFMSIDTAYAAPVEWSASMPMMNWLSTAREVRWILQDAETAQENTAIEWSFERGEIVKIRLRNDVKSRHPMSHPMHVHGQRFLVIARDGVPNENLAWKDTIVVPFGSTVDILVEASNPGKWMLHCHVAEHLEAGMNMVFTVN